MKKEDIADALPQQSHLFKVRNQRHGKVVLPEAFVVHEEDDAQQRAQQHKSNEDQLYEQRRSDMCKGKGERDALAKAFGISAYEIAEQQQALNYAEQAKEKKEIEGQNYQNRKEIDVQKALAEPVIVNEQRQRLEELKQQREKLSTHQPNPQQNAATTGAGRNIPSVQVPTTHSGTHPPHHGPGLPHQHTQPPSRPPHSGGHFGLHHQHSLDANRTSLPSHRPPARLPSHEYETVPGETSSDIQQQGNSDEYDHIGPRGFRGPQSGEQPLHPFSAQRASQNPVPVQRASQHPHSASLQPSPHPSSQPTPPQPWDPHQNQFFPDQAPFAFASSSQQGQVQLGELGVGSTVQISDPPRYGVIKWLGELPNIQGVVAGVELVSSPSCVVMNQNIRFMSNTSITHSQEDYMDGCSDGTWQERRYFTCPYGRGFFCPHYNLRPDHRFSTSGATPGATPAVNR